MIKYDSDFYKVVQLLRTRKQENIELALQLCKNLYPKFFAWFHRKVDTYLAKATINGIITELESTASSRWKYWSQCNLWIRIAGQKFNLKFGKILMIYVFVKRYLEFSELSNCICGQRYFCSEENQPAGCKIDFEDY